jgi:hypothetical protein
VDENTCPIKLNRLENGMPLALAGYASGSKLALSEHEKMIYEMVENSEPNDLNILGRSSA